MPAGSVSPSPIALSSSIAMSYSRSIDSAFHPSRRTSYSCGSSSTSCFGVRAEGSYSVSRSVPCRQGPITNACLGEALRRLDLMRESRDWQRARKLSGKDRKTLFLET